MFLLQHAFLLAACVCFSGTGIPHSIKYSQASGHVRWVMVLGMLVCSPFNHLTCQLAQEYFIWFSFKLGIPYVSRLGNLLYYHHLIMSIWKSILVQARCLLLLPIMEHQSLQLEIYLLPVLCLLFRLTSVMSFHCWGWMTYWRMEFLVMDHLVRMQRHCVRCFWTLPQGGWVFVSRRIFMKDVSLNILKSPSFSSLRVLHDVWLFKIWVTIKQITSLSTLAVSSNLEWRLVFVNAVNMFCHLDFKLSPCVSFG